MKKSDVKGGQGQSTNTAAQQHADKIAGVEKDLRRALKNVKVENMYAFMCPLAERLRVSTVGFGGNGEQFCRRGDSGSITAEIAVGDPHVKSVESALHDIMKLVQTLQQDKKLHSRADFLQELRAVNDLALQFNDAAERALKEVGKVPKTLGIFKPKLSPEESALLAAVEERSALATRHLSAQVAAKLAGVVWRCEMMNSSPLLTVFNVPSDDANMVAVGNYPTFEFKSSCVFHHSCLRTFFKMLDLCAQDAEKCMLFFDFNNVAAASAGGKRCAMNSPFMICPFLLRANVLSRPLPPSLPPSFALLLHCGVADMYERWIPVQTRHQRSFKFLWRLSSILARVQAFAGSTGGRGAEHRTVGE